MPAKGILASISTIALLLCTLLPISALAASPYGDRPTDIDLENTYQPTKLFIADPRIDGQDAKEIHGTFILQNEEAYALNAQYRFELLGSIPEAVRTREHLEGDASLLFHRSDAVKVESLAPSEHRAISFRFTVPSVPAGTYTLRIQALSATGRALGWSDFPVTMTATDAPFAYVYPGAMQIPEYKELLEPLTGPNVNPASSFTLNATIENTSAASVRLTPLLSIYNFDRARSLEESKTLSAVTLLPGQTRTLSIPVTASEKSQVSFAELTLTDADGIARSSVAEYRWVVRGTNADVLVSAPVALSQKRAKIHFEYVGPADAETTLTGQAEITLEDANGVIGTETINGLTLNDTIGGADALVSLLRAPEGFMRVTTKMMDDKGTVIMQRQDSFSTVALAPITFRAVTASLAMIALLIVLAILCLAFVCIRRFTKISFRRFALAGLMPLLLLGFTGTILAAGFSAGGGLEVLTPLLKLQLPSAWPKEQKNLNNRPAVALFVNQPVHTGTYDRTAVPLQYRVEYLVCNNRLAQTRVMVRFDKNGTFQSTFTGDASVNWEVVHNQMYQKQFCPGGTHFCVAVSPTFSGIMNLSDVSTTANKTTVQIVAKWNSNDSIIAQPNSDLSPTDQFIAKRFAHAFNIWINLTGGGGQTPQCRDGIDNDQDGATDYPADFSCSGPDDNDETFPRAQCQDGIDNDGDQLIDFPQDPGCSSRQDNDEQNGGLCPQQVNPYAVSVVAHSPATPDDPNKLLGAPDGEAVDFDDDNGVHGFVTVQMGVPAKNLRLHLVDFFTGEPTESFFVQFSQDGVNFITAANGSGNIRFVPTQTSPGLPKTFDINVQQTTGLASARYVRILTDNVVAGIAEGPDINALEVLQAECSTAQCSDGVDNDQDGATDYPADFSCSSPDDNDEAFPKAQCQDGIDNDGDQPIDYPQDPGCSSRQDNDEFNQSSSSASSCPTVTQNTVSLGTETNIPGGSDYNGRPIAAQLHCPAGEIVTALYYQDDLTTSPNSDAMDAMSIGCATMNQDGSLGATHQIPNGDFNGERQVVSLTCPTGQRVIGFYGKDSPENVSGINSDIFDGIQIRCAPFSLATGLGNAVPYPGSADLDQNPRQLITYGCSAGVLVGVEYDQFGPNYQFLNTVSPDGTDSIVAVQCRPLIVTAGNSSCPATPQCRDGIDNDGDGATDYPSDFSCSNGDDNDETLPKPQCQDEIDNDGDGLVDYPQDPGCSNSQDNDEFNQSSSSSSSSSSSTGNQADLSITKTGPSAVTRGNTATYGITVTNNGPATATNVTITDPIPSGFTFSTYTSNATCSMQGSNVVCTLSTLTSGSSTTVSLVFTVPTVSSCTTSTVTNIATVASQQSDSSTGNNTSQTVTTTVNYGGTTPQCRDGIDNDNDGAIDYPNDFSCSGPDDDDETNPKTHCQDGSDNDGDGYTDYPQDPGCSSRQDNDESNDGGNGIRACNDGRDNDGDGYFDYPSDPGCSSRTDDNENDDDGRNECSDGRDNDDDGSNKHPFPPLPAPRP